jgi:hypothetical protein
MVGIGGREEKMGSCAIAVNEAGVKETQARMRPLLGATQRPVWNSPAW